jgi:hypothetical protein
LLLLPLTPTLSHGERELPGVLDEFVQVGSKNKKGMMFAP